MTEKKVKQSLSKVYSLNLRNFKNRQKKAH